MLPPDSGVTPAGVGAIHAARDRTHVRAITGYLAASPQDLFWKLTVCFVRKFPLYI